MRWNLLCTFSFKTKSLELDFERNSPQTQLLFPTFQFSLTAEFLPQTFFGLFPTTFSFIFYSMQERERKNYPARTKFFFFFSSRALFFLFLFSASHKCTVQMKKERKEKRFCRLVRCLPCLLAGRVERRNKKIRMQRRKKLRKSTSETGSGRKKSEMDMLYLSLFWWHFLFMLLLRAYAVVL